MSHEIRYGDENEVEKYTLMAVPDELLGAIKTDGEMEVHGVGEEEAVMTVGGKTYSLRLGHVSNTLLLCKTGTEAGEEIVVADTASTIAEPVRIRPSVTTLRRTLREHTLETPDAVRGEGVAPQVLRDTFKGSNQEYESALVATRAANIEGRFFALGIAAVGEMLAFVLLAHVCTAPEAEKNLCEELDVHADMARAVVGWVTTAQHTIDADLAARYAAAGMLSKQGTTTTELFQNAWKGRMGDAYDALELVKGKCLVDGTQLRYIATENFPEEPLARFSHLFALRSRWTPAEMAPFIEDVGCDAKERERWILRAVRKVRGAGGEEWTAR